MLCPSLVEVGCKLIERLAFLCDMCRGFLQLLRILFRLTFRIGDALRVHADTVAGSLQGRLGVTAVFHELFDLVFRLRKKPAQATVLLFEPGDVLV